MSDKIEEKISLFTKIILSWGLIMIVFWGKIYIEYLMEKGIEAGDIAIICVAILASAPLFALINFFSARIATRITVENDVLTAKLLFRKTIIVPLHKITRIEVYGDESSDSEFYNIMCEGIQFNTLFISFRLRNDVYIFIAELKRRIERAKEEERERRS